MTTRVISGTLETDLVVETAVHTLIVAAGSAVTVVVVIEKQEPEPRKESEECKQP